MGLYLYCQKCGSYVDSMNCMCGWENPDKFPGEEEERELEEVLEELYEILAKSRGSLDQETIVAIQDRVWGTYYAED